MFPFCQPLSLAQGTLSFPFFSAIIPRIAKYLRLYTTPIQSVCDCTTCHSYAIRASFCTSISTTRVCFVVDMHYTDAVSLFTKCLGISFGGFGSCRSYNISHLCYIQTPLLIESDQNVTRYWILCKIPISTHLLTSVYYIRLRGDSS